MTARTPLTDRVVVLDDDPTGTQSVHGLRMLLSDVDEGLAAFADGDEPAVYVLTNTRAMEPEQAAEALESILASISEAVGDPMLILRGDSTLRGHVALELETLGLREGVGVVVPAYPAGGRITVDGVHYLVNSAGQRTPAAETEFAKDPVFGFHHSRLADWATECGLEGAKHELSLHELRETDGDALVQLIVSAARGDVVLPDAETNEDIAIIAAAVRQAHGNGPKAIVRCASPLAAALASSSELEVPVPEATRVLVAVGSHTDLATSQLRDLGVNSRELPAVDVLVAGGEASAVALRDVVESVREDVRTQGIGVLSTPRRREARHGSVADGAAVMDALTAAVQQLADDVDLVVTKGGITSAEIATRSLAARSALVAGQVLTGIPLWHLNREQGLLSQVVVPGNVGGESSLRDILAGAFRHQD